MRKAVIPILLVVVTLFVFTYSTAEDLTEMSTDELLELRANINAELAERYEPPVLEKGMTLIDIFTDKEFAIMIRDKVGAFSINDQVTQDDLDRVNDVQINDDECKITSLEGLQYLRNVTLIFLYGQKNITSLPDCFDALQNLTTLRIQRGALTELPPSICSCVSLEYLELAYTPITALPEDIGNLSSLKKLGVSYTNITALPESIHLLDLEEFHRDGLDLGD